MLRRQDLIDAILGHLSKAGEGPKLASPYAPSGPRGKLFLSEYDLKKRLTDNGTRLTIPKDSIISPLAQDWLTLKGIRITRE